jgi:hypothetical protein
MKALLGCAVLGVTLLAGTACGSPAPTCETASAAMLKTISEAARAGTVEVKSGKTLKSADHDNTYLVAATMSVAGAADQVGVWATTNLNGEGAIYSVDQAAKAATSFADAAQAEAKIGADDSVVGTVKGCL